MDRDMLACAFMSVERKARQHFPRFRVGGGKKVKKNSRMLGPFSTLGDEKSITL